MTIQLNQGHFAAVLLFLGLAAWMASGSLEPEQQYQNPRPVVLESGLARVQVTRMEGQLSEREVLVSAHTAANRRVELRSEIRAKVIDIHKQKGELVKKGDLIIELDARDWPARVAQAKANLEQRKIEQKSVEQLYAKGLTNDAAKAQAQTAMANAQAELINAQLQVKATKIRAPFAGIVDQRMVEVGDFVKDSSALVTVLDFSPYVVTGQVAEQDARFVNIGDPAYAKLINGDVVEGRIRFIAAEANPQTRTFATELEIANPSGVMTSGLTAKIHVPQPAVHAYYVSPALLIINDEGLLGLKGINEEHKVVFHPINLLKADNRGVWVYGPGERLDLITVGQGFVDYDQQVEPVFVDEESSNHKESISTQGSDDAVDPATTADNNTLSAG